MPSSTPNGVVRQTAPEHYQDRLTQVGGVNRYGLSNFKLSWAQTETTRHGGEWEAMGEQYVGYRDVYLGDGLPHWMLLQWADAGKSIEMPHLHAQSDIGFYEENQCPKTGLQILGGYQYQGSYQIALPLCAKWFEAGKLNIRAFPLSTEIIEMMVPIIKGAMMLSVQAKLQYIKAEKEKEDDQYAKSVDDIYNGIKLTNAMKSAKWMQDKVRSMEQHFNAALITRMHRDRQFQSKTAIG